MQRRFCWRTFTAFGAIAGRPRVAVWVVASVVLLIAAGSCAESDVFDRLTIVNETPYDLEVDVRGATDDGWLLLGQATHDASTVKELVVDQGTTWTFRFQYGGEVVGTLRVERQELSRNRWRVEVPSSVGERLRDLGFPASPDR